MKQITKLLWKYKTLGLLFKILAVIITAVFGPKIAISFGIIFTLIIITLVAKDYDFSKSGRDNVL